VKKQRQKSVHHRDTEDTEQRKTEKKKREEPQINADDAD
jgi:hypothetical protein